MYVIIVGGSKIGHFLAKHLVNNKHTVVLIEQDKSLCDEIAKELDITVICGDGCDPYYLEEAGILRADVIAAVTGKDDDNLVICQLAKEKFHIPRTVARVNDPRNSHIFSELGVDIPIDATEIIAKIIEEEVLFSDFVNLLSFNRGKLAIVRVDLPENSPVINKMVKDISLPKDSVLVSIVRKDQIIVPKGDTVLLANDDIIALTLLENKQELLRYFLGNI
ncbi:MAG: TrkA family potassium uptake protein [Candidatus Omnitrophica bacterium]|nr:TrkA family potassium uptake protein [Candidatus Omnitrophota bacterium]MCM8830759.1 TrkA family potassium uptake protein [Candidatus Omnitrophota bacterium]